MAIIKTITSYIEFEEPIFIKEDELNAPEDIIVKRSKLITWDHKWGILFVKTHDDFSTDNLIGSLKIHGYKGIKDHDNNVNKLLEYILRTRNIKGIIKCIID